MTLEKAVNDESKKLILWLNENRLALNVSKTNFVIFRADKPLTHNVTLIMNRKALQQKDHVKYLGVLVDEHLNWGYHAQQVAKKIGRGIGILVKLRQYLNPPMLKNIYHCLVFSHLSRGIQVWGSASASILNPLIVLQKAVRILANQQYFLIYGDPGPLPRTTSLDHFPGPRQILIY